MCKVTIVVPEIATYVYGCIYFLILVLVAVWSFYTVYDKVLHSKLSKPKNVELVVENPHNVNNGSRDRVPTTIDNPKSVETILNNEIQQSQLEPKQNINSSSPSPRVNVDQSSKRRQSQILQSRLSQLHNATTECPYCKLQISVVNIDTHLKSCINKENEDNKDVASLKVSG